MMSFVRWFKTLLCDMSAAQPYAVQDSNPPRIRQRLDRYTN